MVRIWGWNCKFHPASRGTSKGILRLVRGAYQDLKTSLSKTINNMEILPYIGVGTIFFKDSIDILMAKFSSNRKKLSKTIVLGKEFATMHINDLKCHVVFSDDFGTKVDSIEFFGGSIVFEEYNLFKVGYVELENFFLRKDPNLEIDDEGFKSNLVGVYVGKEKKSGIIKVSSILIFSKEYSLRKKPNADDIINHYLKKRT